VLDRVPCTSFSRDRRAVAAFRHALAEQGNPARCGDHPLHDEAFAFAAGTAELRSHEARLAGSPDCELKPCSSKARSRVHRHRVARRVCCAREPGALAACALVAAAGFVVRRPSRGSENTLKFAVAHALAFASSGRRSLGVRAGEDLAIVGFAALFLVAALGRRSRARLRRSFAVTLLMNVLHELSGLFFDDGWLAGDPRRRSAAAALRRSRRLAARRWRRAVVRCLGVLFGNVVAKARR